MTSNLPPDRLRAMARAIDPEAFVEAKRGWRTGVDAWAEHLRQLEARRAKALAAAQACWEASPGTLYAEALEKIETLCTKHIKAADGPDCVILSDGTRETGPVVDLLFATLRVISLGCSAALRQALPQGDQT